MDAFVNCDLDETMFPTGLWESRIKSCISSRTRLPRSLFTLCSIMLKLSSPMSIINDKERVETTNQISAIDIQESSGFLKDHISTS